MFQKLQTYLYNAAGAFLKNSFGNAKYRTGYWIGGIWVSSTQKQKNKSIIKLDEYWYL